MRICFIADARSQHTQRFVRNLYNVEPEHDLLVISTRYYPSSHIGSVPLKNVTSYQGITADSTGLLTSLINSVYRSVKNPKLLDLLSGFAYFMNYLRLKNRVRKLVYDYQPDIVHGMRLELEGGLAVATGCKPLALSVWGNDLVLYARRNIFLREVIKRAVKRADLLVTDNERDLRLALQKFGLSIDAHRYIMPAQGGVDFSIFQPADRRQVKRQLGLNPAHPLIISLRGFVANRLKTETLVRAIPSILERSPYARFVIHGRSKSTGRTGLVRLARSLGVEQVIQFLDIPSLSVPLYLQAADIIVSVTTFDGVPMSMLEAMSCGCIPVMSDIDAIREWIVHGHNGFLFDPFDTCSLAQSVLLALQCDSVRIASLNQQLVRERADYVRNLSHLLQIYRKLNSPCGSRFSLPFDNSNYS